MPYLLDTSVLVRLANIRDPYHPAAANAVACLHRQGESLHITPQNLVEFRNAATRPTSVNGLGLTTVEAASKAAIFEATFPLLEDASGIFPLWKLIVHNLDIAGKQVHDARLVAVCHVYGVSHVLTFNLAHFIRLSAYGGGLIIVDPSTVH